MQRELSPPALQKSRQICMRKVPWILFQAVRIEKFLLAMMNHYPL